MSANTQETLRSAKRAPREFVRAAAVRAPLQLLLKENGHILRPKRRELQRFTKPKFAESLIAVECFFDVLEEARHLSPSSDLFLRAGLSPHLASLGLYGKAAVLSETLWDALKVSQECMKYFLSSGLVRVQLRNGRCRIIFESMQKEHPGNVSCIQYVVAMYVLLLRQAKTYYGSKLRLYYPNARSTHSILFPEAELLRSCPIGIVDFDENLLRSSMIRTDAWLSSVAKIFIDGAVNDHLTSDDLPSIVEELQSVSISTFHSSISVEDMARILDLKVRTLQSNLLSEETTFAEIRNKTMHKLAKRHLSAGHSIGETGRFLGFQHRQSFSEAFSKWEGRPPSRFALQGRA